MEKEEFAKKIQEQANLINIKLENEDIIKFYKYMNMLLEWNENINLTAIIEPNEIISKHFIDCLTINKYINDNDLIVDVGTGAGFPGIPLKIINENIKVTLLDSLNKRINFLNEVIKENDLKNITTTHERVEDFGINEQNREKYDIATSRAVANLSTLVEYLLPLVKVGGRCICMKGNNIKEEVEMAKNAIEKLGGKIIKIEEIKLPKTDIQRNIIIIEKVKKTPNIYPRKAGIPAKKPIK